jgi:tetratricopeptide (TPR) repeat protein
VIAATTALIAVTVVDRVFHARDERAAALDHRRQALAPLTATALGYEDEDLELLWAERSPVPFRGRRRELKLLADWRANESACSVLMISGSAGVGKSRLALEFASRLPEEWTAGWLRTGAGGTVVSAVRRCGEPAVILVDDAEGRADVVELLDDLAELLDDLAKQHKSPEIRVVLLTRSYAGLRTWLGRRLEPRHNWMAYRAENLPLQPEGGPEDWQRWFREALVAFADIRKVRVPDFPAPFPSGRANGQPILTLLADALLAVLGSSAGNPDPPTLSFNKIAEGLMEHERRRWRAMASVWDWGRGGRPAGRVQEQSIAALALLGAGSETEAKSVLRRVPNLRDTFEERLSAIASWVLALYPAGPNGAPRIRPDMIGEWFVVSQLAGPANDALRQSLCEGLTDAQAARALGLLARAADRIEAADDLFGTFASGDIRRQVLAAAQAAMTGEAGQHLLDTVVTEQIRSAQGWTLAQLAELDRLVPDDVMPVTRAAIAELEVTLRRTLAKDNPAYQDSLAPALNNLGIRLQEVGRYREALAVTQEAVILLRALAKDNPAYQDRFVKVLSNLGIRLREVGRYQEALAAAERAVTLFRALAKDNVVYQDSLATELNHLGQRLQHVGRYHEALAATEDAVNLRRALAADNLPAHLADLATTLAELGGRLGQVGRNREALAATEDAVTRLRALAKDNPAHLASLARGLGNLGVWLSEVGRYREALAATEEAVTLDRALAKDNPAAHQDSLARALDNLASRLRSVGSYQEALAAAQEAVALRRTLAADNLAAHQDSLATELNNLGLHLRDVGRYQEALATTEKAVTLCRTLAKDNHAAHQHSLASALDSLGIQLHDVSRYHVGEVSR